MVRIDLKGHNAEGFTGIFCVVFQVSFVMKLDLNVSNVDDCV
jgi:hypothetical protein